MNKSSIVLMKILPNDIMISKKRDYKISTASRRILSTSSMLLCYIIAIFFPTFVKSTPIAGSSLKYDQSQSGDYNVQVHLKNIEVYAILDDSGFGNEQYDYDYTDMTLKPPPAPQEGSATSTGGFGSSSSSSNSSEDIVSENVNIEGNATSLSTEEAPTSRVDNVASDATTTPPTQSSSPSLSTTRTTRRCGAGFYRDHFGRCRRVRHPQIPLLNLGHLQRKNNISGKSEEENKTSTISPSTPK